MSLIIPGLLASLCYLAAAVLQLLGVLRGTQDGHLVKLLGAVAVISHGVTVYQDFFEFSGYNLGLYPMLSLMTLSVVSIVMLSSLRRQVDNLFIVLFPLAAGTVLLELLLQGNYTPRNDFSIGVLGHIALSITAYSLLTIAAVQAIFLSFSDSMLRHRQLAILRNMPALETMEQLMFEMLWSGLIFLTLSIATGFVSLENLSDPGLIHHTVITLAAWIVFSVLMWGRYQLGWRGAVASRWTLSGFVLLALGYFGSKLVLEIILVRT